jgi:predicted GIY-YIG superfamily endonuclease
MATVYLLHFDRPYPRGKRPRHYLGWAVDLEERLQEHRRGEKSRLMLACAQEGIGFRVVRTWAGGREMERRLKRRKAPFRLCPECCISRLF